MDDVDLLMRTSQRMLKQLRRATLAALIFSGCANVLLLAVPLYITQVFETAVPLARIEPLVQFALLAGLAVLAVAVIEMARDLILLRGALWLDHELGHYALENGIKTGAGADQIESAASNLGRLRACLMGPDGRTALDAAWVPVLVLALAMLHPVLGAIGALGAVLILAVAVFHDLSTRVHSVAGATSKARADGIWRDAAREARGLGGLSQARTAADIWEASHRAHVAATYVSGQRAAATAAVSRGVQSSALIAGIAAGAWLLVDGQLGPGALVAATVLLMRVLGPLDGLITALPTLRQACAAYRALHDLPPVSALPRIRSAGIQPGGRIELRGVSFTYSGRRDPALHSISLDIEPGQCLGVTGANGSGKSTLAMLIAGVLDPVAGTADIDGIASARWQRTSSKPVIGYVPQEPLFLEGAVGAVITGSANFSADAIAAAASRAGTTEILNALPLGYHSPAGRGGQWLGAGERRAVALTRALFHTPRILVLDEPDVGLDEPALQQLTRTVAGLKAEGVTLILATRDAGLLALCDEVAVLNQGTIQQRRRTSAGQSATVRGHRVAAAAGRIVALRARAS